jgi:hypothetical protein
VSNYISKKAKIESEIITIRMMKIFRGFSEDALFVTLNTG